MEMPKYFKVEESKTDFRLIPIDDVAEVKHGKWEECNFCGEKAEKVGSCYIDIAYMTIGKMKGMCVTAHYCPPYARCSANGTASTFFSINFCPYCGRKL